MHVSCIIPAFNESKRIATVLMAVANHHLINEIIVIDDGSSDWLETQTVVAAFPRVRLLRLSQNGGKSAALVAGISEAQGELLVLLDADLTQLTEDHVTWLIEPVLSGKVAMTMSMRKNSPWIDRKLGIDYISGERVFHRSLIEQHLDTIRCMPRFGFETFINMLVIEHKLPITVIDWPDVENPYKIHKHGFIEGITGDIGMIRDMSNVVPFYMLPVVFYKLRRLMVSSK